MRIPVQLYDERGIPLEEGDLIRVFHFRTKRKKYWMYKRVFRHEGFLMAEHYPFDPKPSPYANSYGLQGESIQLDGVTVVASIKATFEDRDKLSRKARTK